ncbi:hypothetical protein SOVF_147000 isoform B [Spinacia oleracea]|nr:hypothetical protein SOVF_147000 isoform B [Spinacia oleracea]
MTKPGCLRFHRLELLVFFKCYSLWVAILVVVQRYNNACVGRFPLPLPHSLPFTPILLAPLQTF